MRNDCTIRAQVSAAVLALVLTACGGGGGSSPAPAPPTPPAPPPATYTVGGNVSGLAGSGMALQLNGADTLSISANGSFTFTSTLLAGANYAVTVSTQPSSPSQNCTVAAGSGSVAAANVSNVAVTCVTPPPTSAPTLAIAGSLKALSFAWSSVNGATFYRLFEDPTGVSGYTQIGGDHLGSVFIRGVSVHRTNWAQGRYVIAACNSGGCGPVSNVATIADDMLEAIGYFKASNSDASDQFGGAIAISGDGFTLAVGAPLEDSNAVGINGNQSDNSAANAGAVYIYVRNGLTWTQQAYIKASNAEAGDLFGGSIALSADGNTLAVGASLEDSNAVGVNGDQSNNAAASAGAAYVFTRTGATWTQQVYLKASNPNSGDNFGDCIAISSDGNTLAVGANSEDGGAPGINGNQLDNSASAAGAAYVFTRAASVWSQQAYIKASNPEAGDIFGSSLSLSADGGTLAVGAHQEDSNAAGINGNQADNSALGAGAAYVFTRSASTWTQQAYLKASNSGAGDLFGFAVSLSNDGNSLAVGAPSEDSSATGVNGNQADNSAGASGAAYLFSRNGTVWSQQVYFKAANTEASDTFGWGLALSGDGNTLAIGAASEDAAATGINGDGNDNTATNSGAAFVFVRNGSVWSPLSYVKQSNTQAGDDFGERMAISSDGSTLAIAADAEDGDSNGIGGSQNNEAADAAGAVYIY